MHRVVNNDEFDEYYNIITSYIQELEGYFHGLLVDNEFTGIKLIIWLSGCEKVNF
jgi:hypothetical protein